MKSEMLLSNSINCFNLVLPWGHMTKRSSSYLSHTFGLNSEESITLFLNSSIKIFTKLELNMKRLEKINLSYHMCLEFKMNNCDCKLSLNRLFLFIITEVRATESIRCRVTSKDRTTRETADTRWCSTKCCQSILESTKWRYQSTSPEIWCRNSWWIWK